jgi:hypothetical protein
MSYSLKYNYLTPTQKAVDYTQDKLGRLKRVRDDFDTPYNRLLKSKTLSKTQKNMLEKRYKSINPAEVGRKINKIQNQLIKLTCKKVGGSGHFFVQELI